MQKVTSFLEKNVEWLVLGLAGLWVLYVVWFYVVTPPVMAKIEGQEYTPGAVDEVIKREAEGQLAGKLDHNQVPPFDVPDFSDQFLAQMGPRPVEPLPVSLANLGSTPQKSKLQGPSGGDGEAAKVSELAQVPAPSIGKPVTGRDQVLMSVDAKNPNVPLPPTVQPGQGIQIQQVRADRYWVTVPAKFDETQLHDAFVKAKVPAGLRRRNYLSVELIREEATGVDAQGNYVWGNATKVPPIQMLRPPVEKAQDMKGYSDWALKPENQPIILQPPFYQTVSKPWEPPVKLTGEDEALVGEQQQQQQQFQMLLQQAKDGTTAFQAMKGLPVSEQGKFRSALPANIRQEMYQIEQETIRKEREQRRPPPQPERPRRSSNNSPLKSAAMYGLMAQVGQSTEGPILDEPVNPNASAPGVGGASPSPVYQPRSSEPAAGMLGTARFQVGGGQGVPPAVLDVWAHDETVEPGKVYRYRLRVTVRNPVFDTRNVTTDPKLAQIAELPPQDKPEEGWSQWTEAIRIPSKVDFFVQATTPGATPQVRFNIYRWQNGKYNLTTTPGLQPGDMIGSRQAEGAAAPAGGAQANAGQAGVDYTTGWSVVDVRAAGGNDVRVLVMDAQGRTETRYMKADQNNPQQKILSLELQKAAQAAANPVR